MPKLLQYKVGSLIYFHGDPAERVFIVQTGRVNLSYQDIETGEDVRDMVQPGEFFGVKSALGRYPREENAMAMQDTTVMAFTVPEFETLAAANTRIIMKMLKVFSNQLRKVHKQVSSLMEKEEQNPEAGLFSVGEYYLKNKSFAQAQYVFSRYLVYYPSGKNAGQVTAFLRQIEMALVKARPGPQRTEGASAGGVGTPGVSGKASDTAKAYYDAVSLISQQKNQQAYLAFKKIADANEDAEYTVKSNFELGRCLFLLNKFDDCIQHFTAMITRYPKHPDLADALFYMGQSYEKNKRKDLAQTFYKKILSMPGDEEAGTHLKAKRALKELEA